MNLTTRLFCIVLTVLFAFYINSKVGKKLYSEKESIIWMLFSIIVIVLSIFPNIVNSLSLAVGIAYPPSFLFVIGFLFLIIVIFHQGQTLSILNERCKELAQNAALLEQRIRKLENINKDD